MRKSFRSNVLTVAAAAIVSAIAAPSHAELGYLYAVTGAGNDGLECGGTLSSLYELDPSDAEALLIGPVMIGATQARHITALAMHPTTGVLYAIMNDAEDDDGCDDATLLTVDPATGAATIVPTDSGPLPSNIPDMTFDPFGNLYAWTEAGDVMLMIDEASGTWEYLPSGGLSTQSTGLASDSGGRLFLKIADALYRLNQYTGEVFDYVLLDQFAQNMLAFNAADVMFSGVRTGSGFTLFTINPETGVTTTMGSNTVFQISALAFDRGVLTPPVVVDLSLDKEVDEPLPLIGTDVVFTLTLTNHNADTASNVVVRDVLPENFSFVSFSGDGNFGEVSGEWTLASVDPSATLTAEITATATQGGEFTNSAEVVDSDSYDPDSVPGSGDTGSDTYDEVSGEVLLPTLFSISRRDDLLWIVDPELNQSNVAQQLTLSGDTVCGGYGLATQPGSETLFGVVASGDCTSRDLVTIEPITADVTEVGSFGNTRIAAIAFGADGNTLYATSGNAGTAPRTLFTVDPTDATLTQECVLPLSDYGRGLAYGDSLLFDATMDCSAGCQLVIHMINPASFPGDPSEICAATTIQTGLVREPSGMTVLAVGPDSVTLLVASFTELYTVTIPGESAPADYSYVGSLSHDSKGMAFASADVTVAELTVSKSATKNRVKGDKFIEYLLQAQNNGPGGVDHVELTDAIPFGTTLVSMDSDCSEAGGVITCDAGTMFSGETEFFSVVVQVTCKKCSSISNTVTIDANHSFYESPFNNTWQINTSVKGKF